MAVGQFTPQLRSTGDVDPYRFVSPSGVNQAAEGNAVTDICVGITDGSNKAFDSNLHAESGDALRLQPGDLKRIEAGTSITAGVRVMCDSDGTGATAATGNPFYGIAIQTAAIGDIFELFWLSGITP